MFQQPPLDLTNFIDCTTDVFMEFVKFVEQLIIYCFLDLIFMKALCQMNFMCSAKDFHNARRMFFFIYLFYLFICLFVYLFIYLFFLQC